MLSAPHLPAHIPAEEALIWGLLFGEEALILGGGLLFGEEALIWGGDNKKISSIKQQYTININMRNSILTKKLTGTQ